MNDDRSNCEVRDHAHIDINQDSQRRDWAKSFGVTEDELKSGDSASKVRDYLQVKDFINRLNDYVKQHRDRASTS